MAYILYINDVEYRAIDDYEIQEQAGATAIMQIPFDLESSGEPQPFDKVEVKSGSTIIFSGVCGIPESPVYNSEHQVKKYTMIVQSLNALMRRRTITEAYQSKTTTEIVQDLFTNYIADEGITLGSISTIAFTYTEYVAGRIYLADVLDELAAPVGAVWHINSQKEFSFLVSDDLTTVDAEEHIFNLKKKVSGIDLRTVQIISGAKSLTSAQTQTETWLANQKQIIAGYPIYSTPTITINGAPATVGVAGLDTGDASYTFLWTYNSATININNAATVKPATGDTVVTSYIGLYSIEIEAENTVKIDEIKTRTGTSGRIEKVMLDTTILNSSDGENIAQNYLDQYGDTEETITLTLNGLTNTDLLTVWTFDLSEYHITGEYVIVQRRILPFLNDSSGITNRVELVLKNKNFFMAYGRVYNKFDKNIKLLSVRGDDVILKSLYENKDLGFNESLVFGSGDIIFFPTITDLTDPEPGLLEPFYPSA